MSYKEIIAEMEDALREREERISQLMYRIEAQQKELYAWQDSAARERMLETVPIYINSDAPGVSDVIAQSYSNLLVSNVKLGKQTAALEAQLAAAQDAHAKSHEEAAAWRRQYTELLTELGPWRRMGEQLAALREAGMELFLLVDGPNIERLHECDDMPAAVADAYGKVVGDE